MMCPKCSSSELRAEVTNNKLRDQVVRRRGCVTCGFKWFTVEVRVPDYTVGWSSAMQSKPVLRVPVDVTLRHVEEPDMDQVRSAVGRGRARVKKRDSPAA